MAAILSWSQCDKAYADFRSDRIHIDGLVQDYGVSNEHLFCIYWSVIRNSNVGKSFSDIGKSSHFPILEIPITDIGNFWYRKIEFPMLENHFDLLI